MPREGHALFATLVTLTRLAVMLTIGDAEIVQEAPGLIFGAFVHASPRHLCQLLPSYHKSVSHEGVFKAIFVCNCYYLKRFCCRNHISGHQRRQPMAPPRRSVALLRGSANSTLHLDLHTIKYISRLLQWSLSGIVLQRRGSHHFLSLRRGHWFIRSHHQINDGQDFSGPNRCDESSRLLPISTQRWIGVGVFGQLVDVVDPRSQHVISLILIHTSIEK